MKPPICPYCGAENTRLCCLTAFYVALADYPEDQDMKPNTCPDCGANLTSYHQCPPWALKDTDLIVLARAVAQDNPTLYGPDCGPPEYYCQHCEASLRGWDIKREDFKHAPDCPVLIAKRYIK